jgi:hypothetical protein
MMEKWKNEVPKESDDGLSIVSSHYSIVPIFHHSNLI